jgi:hypothetical protein
MKRSTLIPRRAPGSRAQPRPVTPLTIRQATDPLLDRAAILFLAKRIQKIRTRALAWEGRFEDDVRKVSPDFRPSARNLLHYLALRQEDLRELQHELTLRGLTSLGRCDSHVMDALESLLGVLGRLLPSTTALAARSHAPVDLAGGVGKLRRHADLLFGPPPRKRAVRIMVTMPTEAQTGHNARPRAQGRRAEAASIPCTLDAVFRDAKAGHRILFDDGKIEGVIRAVQPHRLRVVITRAAPQGSKLRPEKGINLPDTELAVPALSAKDLQDLRFAVKNSDIASLSFVNRPEDVLLLRKHLAKMRRPNMAVVLKIETLAAYRHLPGILLAGMQSSPLGIMVARGDLAVEAGLDRLSELQEDILWICEAAHIPVIWATQVLEGLAKKGLPSRAEVTDAAMSGRAECVMLNKGPHMLAAIRFLNNVLLRMQQHQYKKRDLLRRLDIRV